MRRCRLCYIHTNLSFVDSQSTMRLLDKSLRIMKTTKRLFSSDILSHKDDKGIRIITMNDLKSRNSLSYRMMDGLLEHIRMDQDKLRIIIITAEGPVFSAGHNLKEFAQNTDVQKIFAKASELMLALIECPVPVLARVDGVATAAGCQLVAQCDMALATKRSTFATPGANVGIFCSTPGIALTRCIPRKQALEMLFTGTPITADKAASIGLINTVCETPEKMDEEIQKISQAISGKSRAVIALGKRFYYQQVDCNLKTAYKMGEKCMVDNLESPDGLEGVQSFIEKRTPKWSE